MNHAQQKVVQYLDEAHATEQALVRVLQSQIAMTPRGSYRSGLEMHLGETRDHAVRVSDRLDDLGHGFNPLMAVVGLAETVLGQALAVGKTPFDLLRGSGGEEKVLKNAKDAAATEALEIATYTAIEQLASAVGDEETARLAASIRADEERMLDRILQEIPKLTAAVVRADVRGNGSYDITRTGAADTARSARRTAKRTTKRTSRKAGRATGTAQPWPGYDNQTVEEIGSRLARASDSKARAARAYEKAHKNRAGVIETADRELSNA
jgi:ferritin-like metal-binding protein YciE